VTETLEVPEGVGVPEPVEVTCAEGVTDSEEVPEGVGVA
jgi:hypothetical protein